MIQLISFMRTESSSLRNIMMMLSSTFLSSIFSRTRWSATPKYNGKKDNSHKVTANKRVDNVVSNNLGEDALVDLVRKRYVGLRPARLEDKSIRDIIKNKFSTGWISKNGRTDNVAACPVSVKYAPGSLQPKLMTVGWAVATSPCLKKLLKMGAVKSPKQEAQTVVIKYMRSVRQPIDEALPTDIMSTTLIMTLTKTSGNTTHLVPNK